MDDGLTLNIDIQGDEVNHKPHLDWRERKKQARERQAQKRQRYSKSQSSRPGFPPAAAPAAGGQHHQQQQQQQEQQQQQQPQQPKQAPLQQHRQQQNPQSSKAAAAKPGSKRPADTLHGYGAVLAQEAVQKQPKAASTTAADGRPKKRPNIAETAAAASAAAEAMTADEQADIMALVQLNMSVEQQLEQEQRQQQQQQQQRAGKKGSKKAAAVEQAIPGVVEFGDAPDEPEARDMLAAAGKRAHGKQQHGTNPNSSSSGSRKDKPASKQQKQQQQDAKQAKPKQQLAQHKVGEMAHAGPDVPAEQRQQLFGYAAAAADGGGGGDGSWAGLGLSEVLAEHLVALNFQEPTQVQQRALPVLLAGRDALVRSPTGSGKTLAYLAPLLHSLQARQPRISRAEGTHALILVPTRELAVQVSDVLTALVRRFCWLVAGMLIGGEHRGHEKARLRKGVSLLVATPGRLLDHLTNTSSFKTDRLSWLVLDEADRLLDLGFEAKLKEIVQALAQRAAAAVDNSFAPAAGEGQLQCQTVLLSATLHPGLAGLASLSMRDPVGVGFDAKQVDGQLQLQEDAEAGGAAGAAAAAAAAAPGQGKFELPQQLQQRYVEVPAKARLVALIGVLRSRLRRSSEAKLVVFFSNCDSVDFHHALLQQPQHGGSSEQDGYDTAAAAGGEAAGGEAGELLLGGCPLLKLHGDMKQPERTSSLVTFSKAKSCVLLCTDVAARGLDFPAVSTIIQYDPSGDPAEYVHRVGRTARMGQQGEALLFLLPSEMPYVQLLLQQGMKLTQEQLAGLLQCLPALVGRGGPSLAVQQMVRKMRKGAAAAGGMASTTGSSKDGSSRGSAQGSAAAAAVGFDGLEGVPGVKPEQAAAALLLQRQLVAVVSRDAELTRMATSAFRSFVRAYTTHPSAMKHVFYVKGLHLGHLAASFGLREAPSKIGAAGSAAERKKRKLEGKHAATKREKQAWHKHAKAAAAMGRG
ncbi:hypothetical protein OEZ86_002992 [Tetradesmus obliquus]|nr:hypothetical protein OEZ86_002992 [Tetradesmus obliquus]